MLVHSIGTVQRPLCQQPDRAEVSLDPRHIGAARFLRQSVLTPCLTFHASFAQYALFIRAWSRESKARTDGSRRTVTRRDFAVTSRSPRCIPSHLAE
jgi:hypothetical protein